MVEVEVEAERLPAEPQAARAVAVLLLEEAPAAGAVYYWDAAQTAKAADLGFGEARAAAVEYWDAAQAVFVEPRRGAAESVVLVFAPEPAAPG